MSQLLVTQFCDYFQICACPPGHVLSANNRTCTTPTACPIDEIKCSEHDVCITKTQWYIYELLYDL